MKKTVLFLIMTVMITQLSSCDKNKVTSDNPFFTVWDTPFGVPPFDKIKTEHYMPAFEEAMKRHDAEIEAIVGNSDEPSFDNVILALDTAGMMLRDVSSVFFNISGAETSPEMQKIEEEVSPLLSAHSDRIMLNDGLFARLKAVYDKRASLDLDHARMRLLEKTYKGFVRSGALLDGPQKSRLQEVNGELAVLGVKFGNNLLADNKSFILELDSVGVEGLPGGMKDAAAATAKEMKKKGWVFTLNKPSLIPFITYSPHRDLREKLYRGYLERCNHGDSTDNKQIINDITRLRTERAHLLGFPSHAAWVLDDEMAKTPSNVYSLLDELWTPALKSAGAELEEMKAIKLRETGDGDFQSWDWWYYAEKVRKAKYDLDEEMLRPYFALENVRQGIFDLSNRLYGITFRPLPGAPVYHKECSVYEVLDTNNSHLGVLYLDMHPRAGKRGGAWCTSFREQGYKNGVRVSPVVSIVCNFTRAESSNIPPLLNLDEVETFFHEFGHALHGLFQDVPYYGLGGVERDFVELPSQIMENWAVEPAMLRRYALHYAGNTPMPGNLIEKITKSSLFNQGFATTEYLAASFSDMDLHTTAEYKPFDVNAFESESLNVRRGLIGEIAPRYRYPYFSHIFDGGYSAGYYSYIWAEVLDKDAYEAFVESGDIFSRKVASDFRRELLSKGGLEDGMVLYTNFRKAEPRREPLLRKRGLITPAATAPAVK